MEVDHRDAPMSNCTVRILYGHALECLLSSAVCEGVQERNRAVELLLDSRLTGDGERDRAQFFRRRVVMFFLRD